MGVGVRLTLRLRVRVRVRVRHRVRGFDGEAAHEDEDDHVGEHDDRRDPHRREQA